ncbi:MAG: tyrosine-type recombinase/integrase [Fibrobacteria bacterium]|nr:tyrosine-type recombinase/integrase [Fibrobacteria bacterium]
MKTDSFIYTLKAPKLFGTAIQRKNKKTWIKLKLQPKDLKSLRHTFATEHVERGVPVDVLRKWMGHTPNSRTLDGVYLHRKSTAEFMA